MKKSKLLLCALLPQLVWAQPPQVATETLNAGFCHRIGEQKRNCGEAEIKRLILGSSEQTAYTDKLLLNNMTDLAALNREALQKWLNRRVKDESLSGNLGALKFNSSVALLGYTPAYMVVRQADYEYLGGEHGSGFYGLHVLNRKGEPVKLALKDILLPGQEGRLHELQETAWRAYLKAKGMDDAAIEKQLAAFPFDPTDNWRFNEGGLSFLFQPHEIAAYSMGTPELTLKAGELEGVVKPEILKEAAAYRAWQKEAR